jgi:hypothetical protein
MSNKKQERLVIRIIEQEGGEDIRVVHTSKGHQSFYFNFRLHDALRRITLPITIGGTPGRSKSGRHVRSLVRSQKRHHSELVEEE